MDGENGRQETGNRLLGFSGLAADAVEAFGETAFVDEVGGEASYLAVKQGAGDTE